MEDDSDWADNYIGTWVSEPSRVLKIRKVGPMKYLATLTIDGKPVLRPWMNGAPTIDMPAEYTFDVHEGADFCIDLWSEETRLALHLDYRCDYLPNSRVIHRLSVILGSEEYMPHDSNFYLDAIGGLGNFFRQSHSPEDLPSSE